ncbi:hypothetical protein Anapl_03970 [Anas platyrhynchos]|uniref:Uncharacterized protein n=1 Tax=Anas platyrhynchos TaxID=8839 RepID=R0M8A7_ANAPL|nr:hypothetical protein Anapl_03970 [Anas platyrhynchos]
MASEKGRVEIPMVMYEQHQEPYRQEPSAPEYCSQEGGYEYPPPPPYSCHETTTVEQPVTEKPIQKAPLYPSNPFLQGEHAFSQYVKYQKINSQCHRLAVEIA